jgi:hypothetical protein
VSTLVAIPGTAGTVSLPAVAGVTPAFGIAAGAPAGLTMTTSTSTTAPASSEARKTDSGATITPFLYITATFSANVNAGIIASEILTLPSSLPTNVGYYCVIFDITTTTPSQLAGPYGPVVPVNGSVTIPNGTSAPAFSTGHTYAFEFYYQSLASPTPTPTATATATGTGASPSPSPTGTGASPSPTPTGSAAPTPSPSPTPTLAGTATAPPNFALTGATATTATVTPPTAPGLLVLPASGGYGTYGAHVSVQFGTESTNAAFALSAGLGSTSADISPAGQFPFFSGSVTPLFYFAIESSAAVTFTQTPSIAITVTSLPSDTCSLYIYANTGGSAYQWVQVPGTTVNFFGYSFSIPAVAPVGGTNLSIPANQTQLGFVGC